MDYIWVMPTSNWKGQLAVCKAESRAMELGFVPSRPLMDCRYDMIVDDGNRLWRIQVKYANGKPSNTQGSVVVKLEYNDRTNHSYTYNHDEIDALVVYIPRIDHLCWLAPKVYVGKKRLSVRVEPPKNGQKNGLVLASDYFW